MSVGMPVVVTSSACVCGGKDDHVVPVACSRTCRYRDEMDEMPKPHEWQIYWEPERE
ncbi:hypothetical protein GWI33_013179, partial [Rhynchophorus ferrugineus]